MLFTEESRTPSFWYLQPGITDQGFVIDVGCQIPFAFFYVKNSGEPGGGPG